MDTSFGDAITILLAEAGRTGRQSVRKSLDEAGYVVKVVHSIRALLESGEHSRATLALIDADLGGGEGYTACAQLKALPVGRLMPVLMIVPPDESAISRAFAAGADDCLSRPVHPDLLHRRIKQIHAANRSEIGSRLFNSANDAILIVDLFTQYFLDVNRQATKWLGYTHEEFLSMRLKDIMTSTKDLARENAAVDELTTKGHFIYEQVYRTKSGHSVPVEISSRIIDYNGKKALLNFVRDIRRRKQAEDAESDQRRLAEALRDTAAALSSTLKLDEVVRRVLENVERVVPCDTANIMLAEDDCARLVGYRGYSKFSGQPPADTRFISTTPSFNWIRAHQQSMVITDTLEYPGWVTEPETSFIRSHLSAPILSENEVIGFLNLDDAKPHRFELEDADKLMAFANQASIAIRNALLYQDAQRYASDLEIRVARRTEELVEANLVLKEQVEERERMEAQLAEERNLLRTLIDNLLDNVYVKDRDGRFILVNKPMYERLLPDAPDGHVLGSTDYDYLTEQHAREFRAAELELLATGQPIVNQEVTSQDGNRYLLTTKVPLRDAQGKIMGIVGINRDITKLRQVDRALNEERNLLRTLIDNLPDHIYVKDRDSRFLLINSAGLRHMGLSSDKRVLGKTDRDLKVIPHAQRFFEEEQAIIRSGEALVNHEENLGEGEWFLVTKVPLRDSAGEIIGIVGINNNVTELKQAEERVRHILEGSSCLLWYAIVEDAQPLPRWEIFIANEVVGQRFLPLNVPPNQNYLTAWQDSVLSEDRQVIDQTSQNALRTNQSGYTQEFRCRDGEDRIRWMHEDVQIRPLTPGRWSVVGIVTDVTERRQAEETLQRANELLEQHVAARTAELSNAVAALSESEARFRALVEHAPEAIVVFNAESERFIDVNDNAVALFGLSRNELLERGPMDFSPDTQPDGGLSAAVMRDYIQRAINGEVPVFEWIHHDTQQREIPCEVRLLLLPTSGKPLIRGSITDITVRKQAERAEREQRMLAEALSGAAADMGRTLDLNDLLDRLFVHVERVIPAYEIASIMLIEDGIYVRTIRLRALTKKGLNTTTPNNRFYLDSLPELRRIVDTEEPIIMSHVMEAPGWLDETHLQSIHSYIAAPIQAEGRIIGFINLCSQHPDRFSAEHARLLVAFTNQAGIAIQNARLYETIRLNALDLRQRVAERTAELEHERGQLRAILDAMTEGVIYFEHGSPAQYINQSLARLTGFDALEFVESADTFLGDTLPEDEAQRLAATIEEGLRRHGIWRGEARMRRKDGEEFEAGLVATSVSAAEGEEGGAVMVVRDLSHEKRLETQKARFIANASHELRTPITNIKTRLYLISKQPEKLDTHLRVLESVTDRMRKLVDDLLDVSRFDHGMIPLLRQDVVLQDLVANVVHIQQPEADNKRITLTMETPSAPLIVSADMSRLTQVMTNLLTNAINYTPEGGKIDVIIDEDDDGHALIYVQDTGIGIPPDLLPNVFKPFFRGDHYGGTGLGLSIAKDIVDLHDGDIHVESEQGKGTRFTVKLLLAETAVTIPQPPFAE